MNRSTRTMPRLAAFAAATTLATAGLVAAPTTANAAPTHAHASKASLPGEIAYKCKGPLGLLQMTVTVTATDLPASAPTELLMDGGISVDLSFDLPGGLFSGIFGGGGGLGGGGLFGGIFGGLLGGGLGGLGGGITGQIPDFGLSLGDEELPMDDVTDTIDDPADDPVMTPTAVTDDFTLPEPGTYELTLPDEFTFSPFSFLGIKLLSITCVALHDDDTVVDEIEVDEQDSDTDIDVIDPVDDTVDDNADDNADDDTVDDGTADEDATGMDAPVVKTVVVRELGGRATGRVVTRVDGRKVATSRLASGRATTRLSGLRPGRHKVTVTYLGNGSTRASKQTMTFRIPR
ncbi:MAG: hypothetical protein F2667_05705 [Actinobacteria bacterium]|uniref:Unannotated protein n=1 Tax=freshwater metagenome TaxID=449393 RepID=A0A6J6Q3E5_9ZZZZ|nr:hypothetical protein [Actinomycetota bacterium]